VSKHYGRTSKKMRVSDINVKISSCGEENVSCDEEGSVSDG
jgi:hypothetical protein